MEQTNTPDTPDQQARTPLWEPTQQPRPDEPVLTESVDPSAPPTDNTGFEPV